MADDNRALVQRYYDLVDVNDVDGLVALFADDAVYERPGYEPLRGKEAIEAFYRGGRVIERGQHTLTNFVVGGGDVAVEGGFSGVLRDGRSVEVRFADFFRIADRQFLERHTYFFAPSV